MTLCSEPQRQRAAWTGADTLQENSDVIYIQVQVQPSVIRSGVAHALDHEEITSFLHSYVGFGCPYFSNCRSIKKSQRVETKYVGCEKSHRY